MGVHVCMCVLERKVPLRLNYSKYCDAISQDNLIRLGALLIDYSTREGILAMRTIVLENPEIKIKVQACCHYNFSWKKNERLETTVHSCCNCNFSTTLNLTINCPKVYCCGIIRTKLCLNRYYNVKIGMQSPTGILLGISARLYSM